jgi:hypothetical protein
MSNSDELDMRTLPKLLRLVCAVTEGVCELHQRLRCLQMWIG